MRAGLLAGAVLTLVVSRGAAQEEANGAWLSLGVAQWSFSGAARDTVTVPGVKTQLRPDNRLGLEAALALRRGAWEGRLTMGLALGHLTADNDALALEDKTTNVERYRASLSVGRQLLRTGRSELILALGPTFDLWTTTSFSSHVSIGGQAHIGLRLPIGGLELENSISLGWSTSPFGAADVPAEVERITLRGISVGTGLRFPL